MRDEELCAFDRKYGSKHPDLIQRMAFRKEPRKTPFDFDDLLSMDYMGSSEFEWGAMPKSLKRIVRTINSRFIHKYPAVDFRGDNLCLLARTQEEADKYYGWLVQLLSGKSYQEVGWKPREFTNLWEQLPHEKPYLNDPVIHRQKIEVYRYGRESTNAWWDLEFDIVFCFGHKKLTKIKHSIIQILRNKQAIIFEPTTMPNERMKAEEWVNEPE
jgi:hypothetical protein